MPILALPSLLGRREVKRKRSDRACDAQRAKTSVGIEPDAVACSSGGDNGGAHPAGGKENEGASSGEGGFDAPPSGCKRPRIGT